MEWRNFKKVEISITTYCQASCPVCARTNTETLEKHSWLKLEHLPLETYIKFLDGIQHTKISYIQICGDYGDPLMHPNIEEIIKVSVERGYQLDVHTNGGIRNPQWFRRIAELYGSNIKMIFGIDGVDAETSSKYRIGVDFERAFENMIAYATAPNGRVFWDFLLFNFNKHQMPAAHDIAKKYDMELLFNINTREYKDFKITDKDEIEFLTQEMFKYEIIKKGKLR